MTRKELALKKHSEGCNCACSVLLAFGDVTGLSDETALKLAEGFGGGIGGMHSVCGAVTGMIMAANLILGKADINNPAETKKDSYLRTKMLAMEFVNKNGSMICAELLGGEGKPKLRSCDGCIEDAVEILEKFMEANK